MIKQDNNPFIF